MSVVDEPSSLWSGDHTDKELKISNFACESVGSCPNLVSAVFMDEMVTSHINPMAFLS
jgi:hypothetical protein